MAAGAAEAGRDGKAAETEAWAMIVRMKHDRITLIVPPEWLFWVQETFAGLGVYPGRCPIVDIVVCREATAEMETDLWLERLNK